jgi:NAD(P)-dependent dehydrogenase (short-subunit alcohol dehydrogenase family)
MTAAILVTGASSGLGLATSLELAAGGRPVILACRSVERGRTAAERIREQAPDARVDVLELDLASLASVRAAVASLDDRPLGGLVCNAGVQIINGFRRTGDGFEETFATNHLGHFLLTTSLLGNLAKPARVVVIGSGTHFGPWRSLGFPGPRWTDPRTLAEPAEDPSPKAGRVRYSTSKLANLYLAYELARRVKERGITVNAFDPGLMPETGLARDYSPRAKRLYALLTPMLVRAVPAAHTAAHSAADLAWLATSPEVEDVTGQYFLGRKTIASSKESYDRGRAERLWAVSEELVKAA